MITLHKRINIETADFGPSSTRVATITTAMDQERAVRHRRRPDRTMRTLPSAISTTFKWRSAGPRRTRRPGRGRPRLDAARKAEADAADQRKLNDVTEKLRTAYMMQPGASESEFTRVLPDLLLEQRRQAALGASAEFDRQLAEQRRRIGAF